jgi:malate/lactate dehydrogenase
MTDVDLYIDDKFHKETMIKEYLNNKLDFNINNCILSKGSIEIIYINQSDEKDKSIKDCIKELEKEMKGG